MRRALVLLVVIAACKRDQPAPQVQVGEPPPRPGTAAWKILDARSAAPRVIGMDATVIDWPANDSAQAERLALGGNGWTCWPDNPATPGDDPMCLDDEFVEWQRAANRRRPPIVNGMGVAYMLKGGADGPHIEIIMPNPARSFRGLPATAADSGPWIKSAGTPWARLIVPARNP